MLLVTACSESGGDTPAADQAPDAPASETTSEAPGHGGHGNAKPGKLLPLREGEDRLTLTMPEAYTPSAPTGKGTDDYRCFMLDPKLNQDAYLTGTNVLPGNPDVVHHVILFRVPPDQVDEAATPRRRRPRRGLDLLRWHRVSGARSTSSTTRPGSGAWAPGGSETKTPTGTASICPAARGSSCRSTTTCSPTSVRT